MACTAKGCPGQQPYSNLATPKGSACHYRGCSDQVDVQLNKADLLFERQ